MRPIGPIPSAEETSPQYIEGRKILASGDRSIAARDRIQQLAAEDPVWADRMLMEIFTLTATTAELAAIATAKSLPARDNRNLGKSAQPIHLSPPPAFPAPPNEPSAIAAPIAPLNPAAVERAKPAPTDC